jgi:hypothetical protein
MAGLLGIAPEELALIGGLLSGKKGDNWGMHFAQLAAAQDAKRRREQQEMLLKQQMEQGALGMEQSRLQLDQLRQTQADEQAYRGALQSAPNVAAPRAPNMAPTPENAANLKAPNPYEQARQMVEYLRSKGVSEKYIKPYADQMKDLRPKFKADQQLVKLPDGSLGLLNMGEDGSTQVVPYTPAEKNREVNLGGSVELRGEYSGSRVGAPMERTMSPEGRDASSRGWAGLSQAERHFQQTQDRPQYDSERGVFITRPTPGRGPSQIPVPGLESGKTLPAGELDKIQGVRSLERLAGQAGEDITNVTSQGGNATGPVLGRLPQFIKDWWSPEGIPARQKLANLTSREFLERSGAAVTESEAARLMPYTPNERDTEETIQRKLVGLRKEYQTIVREREENFRRGGYRVPSSGAPGGASADWGGGKEGPKFNGLSMTLNGKTMTFPSEAAKRAFMKEAGL